MTFFLLASDFEGKFARSSGRETTRNCWRNIVRTLRVISRNPRRDSQNSLSGILEENGFNIRKKYARNSDRNLVDPRKGSE